MSRGIDMSCIIRKKEVNDCEECERIITLSWQQTYKGIVSDEFLLGLKDNESERINKSINNFYNNSDIIYVVEVERKVVGFISFGHCDDKEFDDCGEIFSLYIIEEYKGKGYGRKLCETAINHFKLDGYDKMIVGCIDGNPSNNFYKHIGGKKIREKVIIRGGQKLVENIYFYGCDENFIISKYYIHGIFRMRKRVFNLLI